MDPPSSLPAAWRVSAKCFDRYVRDIDPTCEPSLREDLESFAETFAKDRTLQTIFIDELVPWSDFVRPSNAGHAAVADFLITKAAASALSGNYDTLIERKAHDYGSDMLPSLDGDEALTRARKHSPLLKFHGCSHRDRGATVWAPSQLSDDPVIRERIAKTKVWMASNLRGKDLLVVGFWSDWSYLNVVLAEAMTGVAPLSVTVIDPSGETALQAKAPALWAIAHSDKVDFFHVLMSGADALDDLRKQFAKTLIRQVLSAGRAILEAETGTPSDPAWMEAPEYGSEDLYALRRDIEGVPSTSPASLRRADAHEVLGHMHLLLKKAGATTTTYGYELAGKRIRVVNGAGRVLSTVRDDFKESPLQAVDIVVCAGAQDYGVPGHILRPSPVPSVVRGGTGERWIDAPTARAELAI